MPDLWNIFAEITVEPEDFPSGDTNGFMNILTWANSADEARSKIENYFVAFSWHVVEVEEAKIVDLDFDYDDEEYNDLVERAKLDQSVILLGTFHSFPPN